MMGRILSILMLLLNLVGCGTPSMVAQSPSPTETPGGTPYFAPEGKMGDPPPEWVTLANEGGRPVDMRIYGTATNAWLVVPAGTRCRMVGSDGVQYLVEAPDGTRGWVDTWEVRE